MKPWQHGIELDTLKALEEFYAPHNKYALSVFGKFKKNDIAEKLHTDKLTVVRDSAGKPMAAYVHEIAKVPTKIKMFGDVIIGEKQKWDHTLSRLVGDPLVLLDQLEEMEHHHCWLTTYAGNTQIRKVAERAGFEYVGMKVTSFAEVLAVYFRNDPMAWAPRTHPTVNPADLVSMAKICDVDSSLLINTERTLKALFPVFTNHYSNYNKDNAWSALALRGYLNDSTFITKPQEMNEKWKQEHDHCAFFLQDTKIYNYFDAVKEMLSFLDGDIHRVRFMRLAPGGGELERHTDQVDPDAGNSLGKLARLHFPIKTNDKVIFSTWNKDDIKEDFHYGFGECWIIDTRKPHMAVNGGDQERIHLVVDTIVTPKLEQMIINTLPKPEVL